MCASSEALERVDLTEGLWISLCYTPGKYQDVLQSERNIFVERYEAGHSRIHGQMLHMPADQSRTPKSSWLDATTIYPRVEVGPCHHGLRSGTSMDA